MALPTMTKSNLTRYLTCMALLLILSACSTTPSRPATMNDLEGLKLDKFFKIDNSLKEILEHINRNGEVIIEAVSKRQRGVQEKPYYIKIMATSEGLETKIFPIESSN
ncbi:MAG: hypothetical protein RQ824_12645 [bacterium]|nr:hypothetical protein [bacterium]